MFLPFHAETVMKRKAPLAAGIMIATILAAALSIFSIEMAALTGAALVVLTGCITARQAYSAIDSRIFVFIAGVIPLGFAMQKTGVSLLFANSMKGIVEGWPPFWILFALFGVVAVFTQFMSDAATTALFAPIAASLASALDLNPQAFVVTVAMASVTAFLTPIGHHGNLLIYGPGGYRFTDFVKVGAPLTLLVAVTVVVLSQILWPV
jgi:di/tricarboxylate transporter